MADSTAAPELTWPADRPRLLAVLPMVCVAWEDGVLTSSERRVIAEVLLGCPALEDDDRRALQPWLEPETPPSPAAVQKLRDRVRDLAPPHAGDAASLTELGLDLAGQAGARGPWRATECRAALASAESTLGMVGREAVRTLLAQDTSAPTTPATIPPPEAASFDVSDLAELLQEPFSRDRARVLELLAEPAFDFPAEIDRATYRATVLAAVRRLADDGFGGLAFPDAYGGAGSPGRSIAVFETLGFGDLSVLVKFGVQFGLWGGSVYQLGTERHHRRYLADIASLALPGSYAMTEIGHGSNVRELETVARWLPDEEQFEIHTPHEGAGKEWIGNAALHGRAATVFAQLEVDGVRHGVHALVVPLRDEDGEPLPGIRIADNGPKEGLNGVDNGRIWFDRVRVPRENLLNRFADVTPDGRYESPIPSPARRFFTMLGTLVAGRISIAAASLSATKTGLTIAVRYSARRRQFGPEGRGEVPILDYLTQQRALLPALATTYGLHFAIRDLTVRYHRMLTEEGSDDDLREIEVQAAGLKAVASRHCTDTLQACREAMGGRGYRADNRFGRLKADTDVFTTFEGANVVLLQLVAKGLITRFRNEMGDLRVWDAVRWVAERAQVRVTELNPVVTRRTDEDHLRDPEFHRSAFAYREERLLGSAARRLKRRIDDGMDSFDALTEVQDHLVSLAHAHVERVVLESFHDAVKKARSPGVSETLRQLAQLYALSRLESDRAWFLEAGYFEPGKARAVREQVNRLCRDVAEHAVFLVDALGIPDAVLKAPDGLRDPRE